MAFDHEKLDVYQLAIEFVAKANDVIERLPRGREAILERIAQMLTKLINPAARPNEPPGPAPEPEPGF